MVNAQMESQSPLGKEVASLSLFGMQHVLTRLPHGISIRQLKKLAEAEIAVIRCNNLKTLKLHQLDCYHSKDQKHTLNTQLYATRIHQLKAITYLSVYNLYVVGTFARERTMRPYLLSTCSLPLQLRHLESSVLRPDVSCTNWHPE